MNDVQRYDAPDMDPCSVGDWVRYEDYKKLQAKLEEPLAAVKELTPEQKKEFIVYVGNKLFDKYLGGQEMTMPHLENCSHMPDGWCLDCVGEVYSEMEEATRILNKAGYHEGGFVQRIQGIIKSRNQRFDRVMQVCGERNALKAELEAECKRSSEEVDIYTKAAIEEFVKQVNARAEREMMKTHRIEGAHHRAIEAELTKIRRQEDAGTID